MQVGGEQIGIDLDAIGDVQAGFAGQLRVGNHADAEDHQVCIQYASIGGFHPGDAAILADHPSQALTEVQVHAPAVVCLAEQLGHLATDRAGHWSVAQFQDMHG
ncbi:hypothetical protein D3C72_1690160 [compost metagenome]